MMFPTKIILLFNRSKNEKIDPFHGLNQTCDLLCLRVVKLEAPELHRNQKISSTQMIFDHIKAQLSFPASKEISSNRETP